MAEKSTTRKSAAQKKADAARQAEDTVKAGSHDEAKKAEVAQKEASVPGSDPRESVTDPAPGKTLEDVQTRKAEHDAGQHGDETEVREPQYFVADEDNLTLIDVSRRLGLHNHNEIAALNGMHNGVYALQKGQKVLLPNSYDFKSVDPAVEGYKAPSKKAGAVAEATGTTTPPEVITDPTVEAKAVQDGVEKVDDYDLKREDVDAAK